MARTDADLERVWRDEAPHVLAALVRRYGDFDTAEDAVQEALLAAATQWPEEGLPRDPRAWLVRVAVAPAGGPVARAVDTDGPRGAGGPRGRRRGGRPGSDDSLALLLLCCHPSLSRPSQVALTLRAVGGLSTAQVARGFLVPEATMAQRISRAKARLRETDGPFAVPPARELPARVDAVLQVLYLVFTEGHTSTSGGDLIEVSLADEAIRLTRELHRLLPGVDEVTGLLALMLLTDARRAARIAADGSLVPLAEQDRARWDHAMISEGVTLVETVLPAGPVGPYQLQAAIAAVHAEATRAEDTDWRQIVTLYGMLVRPGTRTRWSPSTAPSPSATSTDPKQP